MKDGKVDEIINIIGSDKSRTDHGRKSKLSDTLLTYVTKDEFIKQEIQNCISNRKEHDRQNNTYSYSDPTLLSYILKFSPDYVSAEQKQQIKDIEVNYQIQKYGDLIKKARVSKSGDVKEFSSHEKEAMKILYEKHMSKVSFPKSPYDTEYTPTPEDVKKALVQARSNTMRGRLTNLMRGEYSFGIVKKVRQAVSGISR